MHQGAPHQRPATTKIHKMDISIPTYTVSSPTSFTVQVDLEGGGDVRHRGEENKYTLTKRYSDFVALVSQLEDEVGRTVEVALPPKSWFKSKNVEFLDDRRRGLEVFLRRLVKIPHFYSSAALLEFLQLQKVGPCKGGAGGSGVTAPVSWDDQVASITQMLKTARSNVVAGTAERYENQKLVLTAQTRFAQLEKSLNEPAGEKTSDNEHRRRRTLLMDLQKLLKQVVAQLSAQAGSETSSGTSTPLTGTVRSSQRGSGRKGRVLGETDKTRQLNNSGLVQLQKDSFQEQDESLRQMLGTIQRQKELGEAIRQEVDLQNEQLDELNGEVELTGARLKNAQRQVGKFT
ncbi:YALI0C16412p [Yarrowia lipolytica CLIB122]|uniref:YALI0C16412p n=1 Tax=Yarrowia lipolytica (strain CLIB 122 / E 150) TaxID=284591 RepID=Q6CBR0_YARLI|nr:YALI0C16412p [Yarrowia lipolytica CLIB122]CAG82222.1 YALI0C16412p [Yarrowia lipolytica CLIB122]|eukprot:XP_501902.1 YALI0C16412p [Yarrowia lipolytica CLIB122]